MPARFFAPTILLNGDLRISGPFISADELIGDVQVRFLIIPVTEERSSDPPAWTIDGVASCPHGATVFEKIISRNDVPAGLAAGNDVRGIGLAVAVKQFPPDPDNPGERPAPPAFETLTWCVDLKIVAETP